MAGVGMWYLAEEAGPVRLGPAVLPSEAHLEKWVSADPSIIRPGLHRVRNQANLRGKKLDLLCVEEPGTWVIVEFKNAALDRNVLAQAIDYASLIHEMSADDLETEARKNESDLSPDARRIALAALETERDGDSRNIRIVVAGTDISEDLQRMIRYQSNFAVPISSCVLRVATSPTGVGHILYRDDYEDEAPSESADKGVTLNVRLQGVLENAASQGNRELIQAAYDELRHLDSVALVPYKRGIMVAPHENKSRYLAYFGSLPNAVRLQYGVEPLLEFFPDLAVSALEGFRDNFKTKDRTEVVAWATALKSVLSDASPADAATAPAEEWNGRDWYVSFGQGQDGRSWEDARNFGFVSAGGGDWYVHTLAAVPQGARVFAYVPQVGYVGCGTTTGVAEPVADASVVSGQDLKGTYTHANGEPEFLIAVDWHRTLPLDEALREPGLFANQNSACRLKDAKTLKRLYEFFELDEDSAPAHTVDEHRGHGSEQVAGLFDKVDSFIRALDPAISVVPRKLYVAYKWRKNIACVEVQAKKVVITLNRPVFDGMPSNFHDVSSKGHWGTGEVEVHVSDESTLTAALEGVRDTYMLALEARR